MTSKTVPDHLGLLNRFVASASTKLILLSQKIAALEAESILREEGRVPRMPIEFRSQYGEDVFIWDILERPMGGFFIEVGAFDGYSYSTTYALEALGWTGLLIEAIPERAAQCAMRRRGSRVVQAALSAPGSPPTARFHLAKDVYGGMLSHMPVGPLRSAKLDADGIVRSPIEVPVKTMDELLEGHEVGIDVAVIDVEGHEVPLLRGFDLERHRPRILLIEDNNTERDEALSAYMGTKPYTQVAWVGVSRAFAHNDFAPEAQRRLRRF